jgi:hypothetical protein
MSAEAAASTDSPPRSSAPVVIGAAVLLLLLACAAAWWFWGRSFPIQLSAAPAPAAKGWQIVKDPYWVKADASGALPSESQWQGQYVLMVFRNGEPYYQRMIDPGQVTAGKPFDLALEKSGEEYEAAFVEVDNGRPGKRLSNTLKFTH